MSEPKLLAQLGYKIVHFVAFDNSKARLFTASSKLQLQQDTTTLCKWSMTNLLWICFADCCDNSLEMDVTQLYFFLNTSISIYIKREGWNLINITSYLTRQTHWNRQYNVLCMTLLLTWSCHLY